MMLTVLYFAKARDLAHTSKERVEFVADPPTLRHLLAELSTRHPELRGAVDRMRVARNEAFAELDELVEHDDVIALIPPVAGG